MIILDSWNMQLDELEHIVKVLCGALKLEKLELEGVRRTQVMIPPHSRESCRPGPPQGYICR